MKYTLHQLAKMIDHSLLHPALTDQDLVKGCEIALKYDVATVCIKPYYVKEAFEILKNSDVKICTVVGFPHGSNTIQQKMIETRQACKDGATEIDMVVNIGKVLSEDWRYVKKEIYAVLKETHKNGAILKVIFENDYLSNKKHLIKLCQICSILKVDFIKTSTGYGYTKLPNGDYNYKGSTIEDLQLMITHSDKSVQIKAAGGIRTLDGLITVMDMGITRLGASATVGILEEAKSRLGLEAEKNIIVENGY